MSLHGKRKEIYKYEAPWTVYAMNWSVRPDKRFRLALGSFVEEYNNKVGSGGRRDWGKQGLARPVPGLGGRGAAGQNRQVPPEVQALHQVLAALLLASPGCCWVCDNAAAGILVTSDLRH